MKTLKKLALTSLVLSVVIINGCVTKHIDPDDRDTTGSYDGDWVVSVDSPSASRVPMPGNNIMNCGWEPYEFSLTVNGGKVQLRGLERESVVSTTGNFRFDRPTGSVSLRGGVYSGNDNTIIGIYSGNLSGEEPDGKFTQYIPSLGGNACSAKMHLRRKV